MWNSLEPAWQFCLEEAWAAYCAGSVPIGAVVTDDGGQVISRGRNRIMDKTAGPVGPIANGPARTQAAFNHELAHAELNALLSLNLSTDTEPHGWSLYTTMEPCPLCLGAFYMSGARRLHYAARDTHAGSVNLLGTTPYLSRKPIQVFGPVPELEPISIALVVESMLQAYSVDRSQTMRDLWRQTMPAGVALGERLYDRRVLQVLREANARASEMVSSVAQEL